MSTEGTVLSDWVRAVAEALDVPYSGKVPTMRRLVAAVGRAWDSSMASEITASGGGGNISLPAFEALYKGLHTNPPAIRRRVANKESPSFELPVPSSADDTIAMQAIRQRRGQPQFRSNLLNAYDNRCTISNCDVVPALEAAHIRPYGDGGTYETSNGLLLRADLHTLFDLALLTIDLDTNRVLLRTELHHTSYATDLLSWKFRPATGKSAPNKTSLLQHRARCGL